MQKPSSLMSRRDRLRIRKVCIYLSRWWMLIIWRVSSNQFSCANMFRLVRMMHTIWISPWKPLSLSQCCSLITFVYIRETHVVYEYDKSVIAVPPFCWMQLLRSSWTTAPCDHLNSTIRGTGPDFPGGFCNSTLKCSGPVSVLPSLWPWKPRRVWALSGAI